MYKSKNKLTVKKGMKRYVAMAYLGCIVDYLDKLRNNAQVSFAKDGKMIWYNLESINRFLNRMKVI